MALLLWRTSFSLARYLLTRSRSSLTSLTVLAAASALAGAITVSTRSSRPCLHTCCAFVTEGVTRRSACTQNHCQVVPTSCGLELDCVLLADKPHNRSMFPQSSNRLTNIMYCSRLDLSSIGQETHTTPDAALHHGVQAAGEMFCLSHLSTGGLPAGSDRCRQVQ